MPAKNTTTALMAAMRRELKSECQSMRSGGEDRQLDGLGGLNGLLFDSGLFGLFGLLRFLGRSSLRGGGLLSRSVGSLGLGRAGRKAQHHDQNEQKRK